MEFLENASKSDLEQCNDYSTVRTKEGKSVDFIFDHKEIQEIEKFLEEVYGVNSLPKKNASSGFLLYGQERSIRTLIQRA
jgi:hypothetical protein